LVAVTGSTGSEKIKLNPLGLPFAAASMIVGALASALPTDTQTPSNPVRKRN
jgi:hypothetical protein